MLIVNSPFFFTGVWAICKGFIDEKTRHKIKILGHKYQKELFELVDPDNVPEFLGGKCRCPGEGGCALSEAGPWQDFEMVKPVGIKRKRVYSPIAINEDR